MKSQRAGEREPHHEVHPHYYVNIIIRKHTKMTLNKAHTGMWLTVGWHTEIKLCHHMIIRYYLSASFCKLIVTALNWNQWLKEIMGHNSSLYVRCILYWCGLMCSSLQSKDAGIRAVVMLDEQGGNQLCLITLSFSFFSLVQCVSQCKTERSVLQGRS